MLTGERSVPNMESSKKFPCPCCGTPNQLEEEGGYEICRVCGWEDGDVQRDEPDFNVGPNGDLSLNEARKKWAAGETLFSNHPNPKAKS